MIILFSFLSFGAVHDWVRPETAGGGNNSWNQNAAISMGDTRWSYKNVSSSIVYIDELRDGVIINKTRKMDTVHNASLYMVMSTNFYNIDEVYNILSSNNIYPKATAETFGSMLIQDTFNGVEDMSNYYGIRIEPDFMNFYSGIISQAEMLHLATWSDNVKNLKGISFAPYYFMGVNNNVTFIDGVVENGGASLDTIKYYNAQYNDIGGTYNNIYGYYAFLPQNKNSYAIYVLRGQSKFMDKINATTNVYLYNTSNKYLKTDSTGKIVGVASVGNGSWNMSLANSIYARLNFNNTFTKNNSFKNGINIWNNTFVNYYDYNTKSDFFGIFTKIDSDANINASPTTWGGTEIITENYNKLKFYDANYYEAFNEDNTYNMGVLFRIQLPKNINDYTKLFIELIGGVSLGFPPVAGYGTAFYYNNSNNKWVQFGEKSANGEIRNFNKTFYDASQVLNSSNGLNILFTGIKDIGDKYTLFDYLKVGYQAKTNIKGTEWKNDLNISGDLVVQGSYKPCDTIPSSNSQCYLGLNDKKWYKAFNNITTTNILNVGTEQDAFNPYDIYYNLFSNKQNHIIGTIGSDYPINYWTGSEMQYTHRGVITNTNDIGYPAFVTGDKVTLRTVNEYDTVEQPVRLMGRYTSAQSFYTFSTVTEPKRFTIGEYTSASIGCYADEPTNYYFPAIYSVSQIFNKPTHIGDNCGFLNRTIREASQYNIGAVVIQKGEPLYFTGGIDTEIENNFSFGGTSIVYNSTMNKLQTRIDNKIKTSLRNNAKDTLNLNGQLNITGNYSLLLSENATQWTDTMSSLTNAKTGTLRVPSFEVFKNNIYSYAFTDQNVFGNEEELFTTIQFPHSYKLGSTIYCHLHWAPQTNPTGTMYVNWTIEYTLSDINSVFGSATQKTKIATVPATAYTHSLADFGSVGSCSGLSCVMNVMIKRGSSKAGDTYSGLKAYGLFFDCHFEQDSLGSRREITKP